jgi:hypothetical protein
VVTGQIVNYEQFGRCLDVTEFTWTRAYMIAWYCKQEPAPAVVRWNQRWSMPAASTTGPIMTVNDETVTRPRYCLRSPGATGPLSFVTLSDVCPATGPVADDLKWTVYADTGDYATSYRIIDNFGFCLTPTNLKALYAGSTHSDGTAKVKVAPCDSSDIQKWNAPADLKEPTPLTRVLEK